MKTVPTKRDYQMLEEIKKDFLSRGYNPYRHISDMDWARAGDLALLDAIKTIKKLRRELLRKEKT
jgi:hypothetical protein